MRDFKQLSVWEKAHRLTLAVYEVTAKFPQYELYGLASQLRRAVASVPTNIAEGYGRQGQVERCNFINIAIGSISEVEYQLILAKDLNYLPQAEYVELYDLVLEVRKMLASLHQKIKEDSK